MVLAESRYDVRKGFRVLRWKFRRRGFWNGARHRTVVTGLTGRTKEAGVYWIQMSAQGHFVESLPCGQGGRTPACAGPFPEAPPVHTASKRGVGL